MFLVTCLDPRVDPAGLLGIDLEDAPVIRNAAGRITEAVINDIASISYLATTMIPGGPHSALRQAVAGGEPDRSEHQRG